jgi:hypothetical protein
MKPQLISLDTLGQLTRENPNKNPVLIKRNCRQCGCDLEIEIHKTSGGFGLQGGILLESDKQILADCLKCYEKQTLELA